MSEIDFTNDPAVRSWVGSANQDDADFPIQNLPLAVFRPRGQTAFRGGVAIGDRIVDLTGFATDPGNETAAAACQAAAGDTLNGLMALGPRYWSALRRELFARLRSGSPAQARTEACLVPLQDAEFTVPATIGDFTDFYASIHHATAVGKLFRPDDPLLPNYKWLPVGYHGRSSSIVMSGHDVIRPWGQIVPVPTGGPIVAPSRRLDYEVELGVFVGPGNPQGHAIPIADAASHVFGLCLLNDWSARDVQAWEYQPLGPFLAKNFATTLSPWIVSLQALAPYRTCAARPASDPATLPYLTSGVDRATGAFDIQLEAWLQTEPMRQRGELAERLSSTSFRHSYWTVAQLIAHHTVNGCNLRPGDLLGTGTQSGPSPGEAGSLLEISAGGKSAITVGRNEKRCFLEDGDTLTLRGWCASPGHPRIGFGEASGRIMAANTWT